MERSSITNKDTIRIKLMGDFRIFINEQREDTQLSRSRKSMAFIMYLILNHGKQVSNQKLLDTFWNDEASVNPENALKTLVSRLRAVLNQISPDFGRCIVSDRGAYHWENAENIRIDLYEIEYILNRLAKGDGMKQREKAELFERLLEAYTGDLAPISDDYQLISQGITLHERYISAVYDYIDMLKADENYSKAAEVARVALDVAYFDERLHTELIEALDKSNRISYATDQVRYITQLNERYHVDMGSSEKIRTIYKHIMAAGNDFDSTFETIRSRLTEDAGERGVIVCDYYVFKEIYQLQISSLERLGGTMFLGLITIDDIGESMDSLKENKLMRELEQVLRDNLREGDTVSRFAPNRFTLLLPAIDYTEGNKLMEGAKRAFYRRFPNSDVQFNYRISPLGVDEQANEE